MLSRLFPKHSFNAFKHLGNRSIVHIPLNKSIVLNNVFVGNKSNIFKTDRNITHLNIPINKYKYQHQNQFNNISKNPLEAKYYQKQYHYRDYSTQNNNNSSNNDKEKLTLVALIKLFFKNFSNFVLASGAIALLGTSLFSLYLSIYQDGSNISREYYLSRILNYFWWSPPFEVWKNNNVLDPIFEKYKHDELSQFGKRLIEEILSYDYGVDLLYDIGFYDVALDHCLKRSNYSSPPIFDLDHFIVLRISTGKNLKLPQEFLDKEPHISNLYKFSSEKSALLKEMQKVRTITKRDVLYAAFTGALTAAFFTRRLPSSVALRSMINSSIVCGAVISIVPFKRYWNENFIVKSKTMTQYHTYTQLGCGIAVSSLLGLSFLSNIYCVAPLCFVLVIKKAFDLGSVILRAGGDLVEKLPPIEGETKKNKK